MDSGDIVLPYNLSKDLWRLAPFGFGIKESAHRLTQKKNLVYPVFYFNVICGREDTWAMLCWENDGLLAEQGPQSHVRVAAEMEVPEWVCFDCDASHKLCLPHPSANSCSDFQTMALL